MCLTVLFVILQSRVLTLQSKGKESQAQNRTGPEIGENWGRRLAARLMEMRREIRQLRDSKP